MNTYRISYVFDSMGAAQKGFEHARMLAAFSPRIHPHTCEKHALGHAVVVDVDTDEPNKAKQLLQHIPGATGETSMQLVDPNWPTMVCSVCGSRHVTAPADVDPNTLAIDWRPDEGWCSDCAEKDDDKGEVWLEQEAPV